MFFGIIGAIVSTMIPGLLNMYSAKISMTEGKKNAILFALGVTLAYTIETIIALIFAKYLDRNPDIIAILQKVVLGIFVSVTIYFFFIAKDVRKQPIDTKTHSKKNRFFLGFLLSAINLLSIPFWVYVSITFSSFNWFTFSKLNIIATVIGASIGVFLVMGTYIWFFRPKEENQREINLNMNYLIGFATALISIFTLLKILKNM